MVDKRRGFVDSSGSITIFCKYEFFGVNRIDDFPLLVDIGFLVGLVQVGEGGKGFFNHTLYVDRVLASVGRFD